jgi:hypothetical protein
MSILDKYLSKKGIAKIDDLTPEEKEVFTRYERILKGENITVEMIKAFCQSQVKLIEGKIADGLNRPTDIQLASLHVYLNVLKAIEAPEAERESLERYLIQQIQ